jgi:hypothetical protein
VIEEQCLGGDLQEIDEPIVPSDLRELVGEYRFNLLRRESGYRCDGQETEVESHGGTGERGSLDHILR